jgi:Ni/Fe-hydrogenase subunit HybB-like protein
MDAHAQPAPVGGAIFTRPFKVLAALFAVGAVIILWRFAAGLGATTALNDGYPWGLWIAFDVVTGTALACGGYAVAILVYVLNKGRYHPLVRPAILTSALGYTLAGIGIGLDIGRPWLAWKVPLFFWSWNLDSVLLEVALCIMSYMMVLWIELSPAFLERWRESRVPWLAQWARRIYPILTRSLIWIIALGLLLPTMHQSSLGTLMMLAGPRLHPLWHTPWLPLLFLVSCVGMGYATVVFESALSSLLLKRRPEIGMLSALAGAMVPVLFLFPALRFLDLVWQGRLGLLLTGDFYSVMAILEFGLALAPGFMLLPRSRRSDLGHLFRASMLMMLAGAVYRFDTYLVAFRPGDNWSYFPNVNEILVTIGLVSAEIMAYVVIIKLFPILTGPERPAPARA